MGITDAKIEKVEKSNELAWQGKQDLQYYKDMFEREFIRQTSDHYKKRAEEWMQNCSCPEYVEQASMSLKKEEEKVLNFLDKETCPKLLDALEIVLIEDKAQALTEKERTGVNDMFKGNRYEELKKLYNLFLKKEKTLCYIFDKMKPYIEGRGKAVINNSEVLTDPILFINKLLALKKEIDTMVQESFKNHQLFMQTRDRAFQSFMNDCIYMPSFLAEYTDMLMRQGLKGKDMGSEKYIDEVIDLFKLLRQKDAYIARHQQLYALRLLGDTSISREYEEKLVSKLKTELGAQYVSKLVQMCVDIENSKDLTERFCNLKHKGIIKGISMDIKVLTTGLWGEHKSISFNIPPDIEVCTREFETFFKQNHVGKNISWMANQGTCELVTNFCEHQYYLLTSLQQASILYMFNIKSVYTFGELRNALKLPENEFNTYLFSLMNPKMGKLLIKGNLRTPKFTPDEKLSLNTKFAFSNLRLLLVPVAHKAKVYCSVNIETHRRS
jgi:cullin 3